MDIKKPTVFYAAGTCPKTIRVLYLSAKGFYFLIPYAHFRFFVHFLRLMM